MMLWNDGKIYQSWSVRFSMYENGPLGNNVPDLTYLFHGIIIMESSSATHHIDNLTIALMNMKTS